MNPWKLRDLDTPRLRMLNPDLRHNEGVYVSNEAWDDYQAERKELLDFLATTGTRNVIFTSGHTHFYLACELQPDFDDPASPTVAFDFVTGSLTADPDPRSYAPENVLKLVELTFLRENSPYMKTVNIIDQGYAVVDATPEETIVEFRVIDTFDPDAEARTASRFRVVNGSSEMELLDVE
jgi:alkaline phosphatase D